LLHAFKEIGLSVNGKLFISKNPKRASWEVEYTILPLICAIVTFMIGELILGVDIVNFNNEVRFSLEVELLGLQGSRASFDFVNI
jgi:hypothetical protein